MSVLTRSTIKRKLPLLAGIVRWAKQRKMELHALPRHLARRRLQKRRIAFGSERIKVVFICQYIPAWSKNKALYDALQADDRFETMLLCIPNRVHANQLDDPEDQSNDAYDYFYSHGYRQAVNALVANNTWFNLQAFAPDYVFYNRYDRPMPVPYTSTAVSAFSKVCLIVYGVSLLKVEEQMIDKLFTANTFCFFAESAGIQNEFLNRNRVLHRWKLSNAVLCGIPSLENAYLAKGSPSPAWAFSKNSFRVIYAPRWTTDPTWGGSSFLKYSNTFFTIAESHPEIDVLVRPHPLMFQNFIDTGLITAEEAIAFKNACSVKPNIRLDQEKEYLATFWNSSVLICDYSSMIIEYYITGKPIVYLTYDKNIGYTDQMSAMLSGCYLVNDEDELHRTIEMLLAGKDPLAPVRDEVCRTQLLQGDNLKASENIKQVLLDSYRR